MRSWLARLAALVWLAWLLLLGLMFGLLWFDVWHPPFLLMPAIVVVLVAACVILLAACAWRLVRGPRRTHALGCLLLGLAPAAFLTGHLMYGFGTAYGRQLDLNLPLKLLVPFGESNLDVIAYYPYPMRTTGERVVMISEPMPEAAARRQVAAMDRHVRALEARLGRTSNRRIYWVRGPILGLQGKAIRSMCMGSRAEDPPANPDELSMLDRHEVAHVVLSQFSPGSMEPPALLVEGWAEANSGLDPKTLRLRASFDRNAGEGHSVVEFIGPAWYGRHEGPVYVFGAVVVNNLIREFGADRFVELYATCRQATFEEDCRRILGASVAELDRVCLAELDQSTEPEILYRQWLTALELGPGVERADWQRFVSDYLAAARRLMAPYEHVRLKAETTYSSPQDDPQKPTPTWHYELRSSGPLRAFHWRASQREEVLLAHPGHSFKAERWVDSETWTIRDRPGVSPEQRYRSILREIDSEEPVREATLPLLGLADSARGLVDALWLRVTRLERFQENHRSFIRLELEATPRGNPSLQKVMYQFDTADYRLVHREHWTPSEHHWQADQDFDFRDGVPLVRTGRAEGTWEDGSPTRIVMTVTDRRFEAVPEAEFTAEHLLNGARVEHLASDPVDVERFGLREWSRLPVILGLVFLLAGAGLAVMSRRRG
jgi:hypothetical protein